MLPSQLPPHPFRRLATAGFTLVELAIALVIIALLSGGLLVTLSALQDNAAATETQRRINDARDALLGFAAANGRLPCPAAPNATGAESPVGGGTCTNYWDGFLPAITLGITPADDKGYALDAWGNPIRYAVTNVTSASYCGTTPCFTLANGIKNVWAANATLSPDLRICTTSAGASTGASADCAAGATLANDAVAVILSRSKNGGIAPTSADETANSNGDRLFVSHTPTPTGANEFDDLAIWLSPNLLYNRLIAAGRLP